MAIVFEGAASSSTTFASSHSFSFNAGTNPNRAVLILVGGQSNTTTTPASATLAGNAMTAGANVDDLGGQGYRAFWIVGDSNVPSGSSTIAVTMSDGNQKPHILAVAYSGVSAVNGAVTGAAAGPMTFTIASATGDVAVALFSQQSGLRRAATSPAVERFDADQGDVGFYAMDTAGAAPNVSPTASSATWVGIGVNLVQATGGTAPTIDTQPTAQTVTAPATATFTAAVGGTYTGLRWQRQAAGAGAWNDIGGATSTTLTTGATSVTGGSWNNTDRVRLAVDWSGGTVLSNDVALTVNAAGVAPSITTQPSNASVTVGSTAGFTVAATGSGTLTYQWQREPAAGGGFTNISGAVSASYTTPATSISGGSANNGDKYRCVVTGDTSPPATSNQATLTVLQPLATSITFTINGATSLTGLKWAVFEGLTPDAWVAPIAKGAAETTNGSDVCTVSIAGVTTKRVGDLACVVVTNSDGTATGGSQAATRRLAYYIGTCA